MNTEKFVLLCQKGGIITGLVLVPLSVVWWFSGDIFLTLIDEDIAVMAGRCMAMTIPGTFWHFWHTSSVRCVTRLAHLGGRASRFIFGTPRHLA
jgi:hypothetical protein